MLSVGILYDAINRHREQRLNDKAFWLGHDVGPVEQYVFSDRTMPNMFFRLMIHVPFSKLKILRRPDGKTIDVGSKCDLFLNMLDDALLFITDPDAAPWPPFILGTGRARAA